MTLKLITPPSDLITVDEAKLHLRVEHSVDDSLIGTLITAAREDAEQIIGRGIGQQTWQRTLDSFPAGGIQLGMPPVSSIASIQYVDQQGSLQTLADAAYVLDNAVDSEAWAVPAAGYTWPATMDTGNAVQVRFVCGLPELPATIRAWMLLRVGALYANRSVSDLADSALDQASAFVDRLLDRWRVWGG